MPRALRLVQFVIQAAIVGLALAFIATRLWPARFGSDDAAGTDKPSLQGSYASAVAHAVPAVVNIYTKQVVRVNNPIADFFGLAFEDAGQDIGHVSFRLRSPASLRRTARVSRVLRRWPSLRARVAIFRCPPPR